MLNQVHLIGNLGGDPELHTFENGNSVASFSLATSRSWKDKTTNEKKTTTSWHAIKVFNKGAELVMKYLKKGAKVYVSGEINYRQWEGTDGQKHYATEIRANEIKFLDGPPSSGVGQPKTETTGNRPSPNVGPNGPQAPMEDPNDDLPF